MAAHKPASITFFSSYWESVNEFLSAGDEDGARQLALAFIRYAFTGAKPTFTGDNAHAYRAVFSSIRPNIARSRKMSKNGVKGGRPKGGSQSQEPPTETATPNDCEPMETAPEDYPPDYYDVEAYAIAYGHDTAGELADEDFQF